MLVLSLVPLRWKRYLLFIRTFFVIAGGFLVHLSLGTIYTTGNVAPYIISYIRNQSHPGNLKQEAATWLVAASAVGQGGAMFVGGALVRKIGPRWTTLGGGWLMSCGVCLSYFTIKVSYWLLLVTYGLVFGTGVGIAYIGPLSAVMRWMPKWKGLANGIVVAGFGLSALIFNLVQTVYVNPHNVDTVKNKNGEEFFVDPDLLERVPTLFLILGGTYAAMQLVGSLLLTYPPDDLDDSSPTHVGGINTRHDTDNSSFSSSKFTGSDSCEEFQDKGVMDRTNLVIKKFTVTHTEEDVNDLGPKQMLQTFKFYALWYMFLANGLAIMFITPLYKFIGQEFIDDDHFLAIVGSLASVLNCLGRIIWGLVADASSFSTTLVVLTSCLTIFTLTVVVTPYGGRAMFLIWICSIFFCIGGNFSLFPAVTGRVFGLRHVSVNYGILFIAQLVAGLVGALLSTTLKSSIGYTGLLFLGSGFASSTLLLAVCYRIK